MILITSMPMAPARATTTRWNRWRCGAFLAKPARRSAVPRECWATPWAPPVSLRRLCALRQCRKVFCLERRDCKFRRTARRPASCANLARRRGFGACSNSARDSAASMAPSFSAMDKVFIAAASSVTEAGLSSARLGPRAGRLDLQSQIALLAVEELGLDFEALPRERIGVCLVATAGSLATDAEFWKDRDAVGGPSPT